MSRESPLAPGGIVVTRDNQIMLFDRGAEHKNSSTFATNMSLPVHRWFRYSAGFSAQWAESEIRETARA